MNRVLIAAMSAAGHVGPLVRSLASWCGRGHDMSWYTGEGYRKKVEARARLLPTGPRAGPRPGQMDAQFPERARLKGMAKFKFDIRKVFIAAVPGQVADLEGTCSSDVRPDVIVAEPGMAAAAR